MHDLFSEDPNLAFPTTYECFVPHHFLLTEGTLDRLAKGLLPKRRPQDDVPVGFDRPQEEEFAMLMLPSSVKSPGQVSAGGASKRQMPLSCVAFGS